MRMWCAFLVLMMVACDKGSGGGASSWATGAGKPAAPSGSAAAAAPAAPPDPAAAPAPAPAAATAPPPSAAAPTLAAAAGAPAVPPAAVTWKQGDRIQGQWSDGLWYNGKIGAVNDDGTYNINYDDGDHANHLAAKHVRARRAASSSGGQSSASSGNAPCPGPGLTRRCGGVCVNIQEDNNNCGSCGNRCPSGKHCDGHMFCRDADGNL